MKLYVIKIDGQTITKPMTLKDIEQLYGSVRTLEASGHRIVAVN